MTDETRRKLELKAARMMADLNKIRKRLRRKPQPKKSGGKRGRPPVPEETLALAEILVDKGAYITDVELKLPVSRRTLNRRGIKSKSPAVGKSPNAPHSGTLPATSR